MKSIILIVILGLLSSDVLATSCWRSQYEREDGGPMGTCGEGWESDAGLCYPVCREGFYGVGPVCWQRCPPGFTDTGVDCLKPSSYGRGAGYVSKSSCEKENKGGCEQWGALYYPKCREGFHNAACCVCSPNCINGMIDIGVSCQKQSYGRGVGLICSPDEELQDFKCFKRCKPGFEGHGTKCKQNCQSNQYDCGSLCIDGGIMDCERVAADVSAAVISVKNLMVGKSTIMNTIGKVRTAALDLLHHKCDLPQAVSE